MEHLDKRGIAEEVHEDAAVALVCQTVEIEADSRAELESCGAVLLDCEEEPPRVLYVRGSADGEHAEVAAAAINAGLRHRRRLALEEADAEAEADEGGERGAVADLRRW